MEIDFTQSLTDFDGEPIPEPGREKGATLGSISETALLIMTPKSEKLSAAKKVHRAVLAQSIHKDGTVDVVAEDVVMLKEVIGEMFAPLVVMRAYEILDP